MTTLSNKEAKNTALELTELSGVVKSIPYLIDLDVERLDAVVEPLGRLAPLLLRRVQLGTQRQALLGEGLCLGLAFDHFEPLHLLKKKLSFNDIKLRRSKL